MRSLRHLLTLAKSFKVPLTIVVGIVFYLLLTLIHQTSLGTIIIFATVILGCYELIVDTFRSLLTKRFALDYIAILAVSVALISKEYLVASIIALMLSGGRTLENYGMQQAKRSLEKLVDRIPNEVVLWQNGHAGKKEKIGEIEVGEEILVRKGEVVPLDGILESEKGLTDESSLTGEPYMLDKLSGDHIRSGTINAGDPIVVRVTKSEADSTYKKIIDMVKRAQGEKAPMVRLADRFSTYFTFITLAISLFAYLYSGSWTQVLAVLVIATPCPLILATPIALMGGINASAKRRIIVKRMGSLEILSRIGAIIFDKTGTITLGHPKLVEQKTLVKNIDDKQALAIANAIERNSLHPLAKAIIEAAYQKRVPVLHATDVEEKIGEGIHGHVDGIPYTIKKLPGKEGMAIEMINEAKKRIALFRFEDEIKQESIKVIQRLRKTGLEIYIYTGDKKEEADRVSKILDSNINVVAETTPEDKQKGIQKLKAAGKTTAMVGDGINDAPALALADVGMVFSNEEHTAASEAADIVFLGGDFSHVLSSYKIAKRTIHIAMQSIGWGIGLSTVGMVAASFGLIPPLLGAFLQEAIDVAVILNALRASK